MNTSDDDMREGIDSMLSDMAQHQSRFKGEVTAEANRRLAVEAFEQVARQQAEAKPQAQPEAPAPAPITRTEELKTVEDRTYRMVKEPDTTAFRKANEAELWFLQHAMPRIELLLSKRDRGPLGAPSWSERVLAVLSWQQRDQRRYLYELVALLEDSNRLWGDWKNTPDRKVWVGA